MGACCSSDDSAWGPTDGNHHSHPFLAEELSTRRRQAQIVHNPNVYLFPYLFSHGVIDQRFGTQLGRVLALAEEEGNAIVKIAHFFASIGEDQRDSVLRLLESLRERLYRLRYPSHRALPTQQTSIFFNMLVSLLRIRQNTTHQSTRSGRELSRRGTPHSRSPQTFFFLKEFAPNNAHTTAAMVASVIPPLLVALGPSLLLPKGGRPSLYMGGDYSEALARRHRKAREARLELDKKLLKEEKRKGKEKKEKSLEEKKDEEKAKKKRKSGKVSPVVDTSNNETNTTTEAARFDLTTAVQRLTRSRGDFPRQQEDEIVLTTSGRVGEGDIVDSSAADSLMMVALVDQLFECLPRGLKMTTTSGNPSQQLLSCAMAKEGGTPHHCGQSQSQPNKDAYTVSPLKLHNMYRSSSEGAMPLFSDRNDIEFQALRSLRFSMLWAPSNYTAHRSVAIAEVPAMDFFLNSLLDAEERRERFMRLCLREELVGEAEEKLKLKRIRQGLAAKIFECKLRKSGTNSRKSLDPNKKAALSINTKVEGKRKSAATSGALRDPMALGNLVDGAKIGQCCDCGGAFVVSSSSSSSSNGTSQAPQQNELKCKRSAGSLTTITTAAATTSSTANIRQTVWKLQLNQMPSDANCGTEIVSLLVYGTQSVNKEKGQSEEKVEDGDDNNSILRDSNKASLIRSIIMLAADTEEEKINYNATAPQRYNTATGTSKWKKGGKTTQSLYSRSLLKASFSAVRSSTNAMLERRLLFSSALNKQPQSFGGGRESLAEKSMSRVSFTLGDTMTTAQSLTADVRVGNGGRAVGGGVPNDSVVGLGGVLGNVAGKTSSSTHFVHITSHKYPFMFSSVSNAAAFLPPKITTGGGGKGLSSPSGTMTVVDGEKGVAATNSGVSSRGVLVLREDGRVVANSEGTARDALLYPPPQPAVTFHNGILAPFFTPFYDVQIVSSSPSIGRESFFAALFLALARRLPPPPPISPAAQLLIHTATVAASKSYRKGESRRRATKASLRASRVTLPHLHQKAEALLLVQPLMMIQKGVLDSGHYPSSFSEKGRGVTSASGDSKGLTDGARNATEKREGDNSTNENLLQPATIMSIQKEVSVQAVLNASIKSLQNSHNSNNNKAMPQTGDNDRKQEHQLPHQLTGADVGEIYSSTTAQKNMENRQNRANDHSINSINNNPIVISSAATFLAKSSSTLVATPREGEEADPLPLPITTSFLSAVSINNNANKRQHINNSNNNSLTKTAGSYSLVNVAGDFGNSALAQILVSASNENINTQQAAYPVVSAAAGAAIIQPIKNQQQQKVNINNNSSQPVLLSASNVVGGSSNSLTVKGGKPGGTVNGNNGVVALGGGQQHPQNRSNNASLLEISHNATPLLTPREPDEGPSLPVAMSAASATPSTPTPPPQPDEERANSKRIENDNSVEKKEEEESIRAPLFEIIQKTVVNGPFNGPASNEEKGTDAKGGLSASRSSAQLSPLSFSRPRASFRMRSLAQAVATREADASLVALLEIICPPSLSFCPPSPNAYPCGIAGGLETLREIVDDIEKCYGRHDDEKGRTTHPTLTPQLADHQAHPYMSLSPALAKLPTRRRARLIPINTPPHHASSLLLPVKGLMVGSCRHHLAPAAQLLLAQPSNICPIPPPCPMPRDLVALMLRGVAVVGGFGYSGGRGHVLDNNEATIYPSDLTEDRHRKRCLLRVKTNSGPAAVTRSPSPPPPTALSAKASAMVEVPEMSVWERKSSPSTSATPPRPASGSMSLTRSRPSSPSPSRGAMALNTIGILNPNTIAVNSGGGTSCNGGVYRTMTPTKQGASILKPPYATVAPPPPPVNVNILGGTTANGREQGAAVVEGVRGMSVPPLLIPLSSGNGAAVSEQSESGSSASTPTALLHHRNSSASGNTTARRVQWKDLTSLGLDGSLIVGGGGGGAGDANLLLRGMMGSESTSAAALPPSRSNNRSAAACRGDGEGKDKGSDSGGSDLENNSFSSVRRHRMAPPSHQVPPTNVNSIKEKNVATATSAVAASKKGFTGAKPPLGLTSSQSHHQSVQHTYPSHQSIYSPAEGREQPYQQRAVGGGEEEIMDTSVALKNHPYGGPPYATKQTSSTTSYLLQLQQQQQQPQISSMSSNKQHFSFLPGAVNTFDGEEDFGNKTAVLGVGASSGRVPSDRFSGSFAAIGERSYRAEANNINNNTANSQQQPFSFMHDMIASSTSSFRPLLAHINGGGGGGGPLKRHQSFNTTTTNAAQLSSPLNKVGEGDEKKGVKRGTARGETIQPSPTATPPIENGEKKLKETINKKKSVKLVIGAVETAATPPPERLPDVRDDNTSEGRTNGSAQGNSNEMENDLTPSSYGPLPPEGVGVGWFGAAFNTSTILDEWEDDMAVDACLAAAYEMKIRRIVKYDDRRSRIRRTRFKAYKLMKMAESASAASKRNNDSGGSNPSPSNNKSSPHDKEEKEKSSKRRSYSPATWAKNLLSPADNPLPAPVVPRLHMRGSAARSLLGHTRQRPSKRSNNNNRLDGTTIQSEGGPSLPPPDGAEAELSLVPVVAAVGAAAAAARRRHEGGDAVDESSVFCSAIGSSSKNYEKVKEAIADVATVTHTDAASSLPSAALNVFDAHIIATAGYTAPAVDITPSHGGFVSYEDVPPLLGDTLLDLPRQQRHLHQQVALAPTVGLAALTASPSAVAAAGNWDPSVADEAATIRRLRRRGAVGIRPFAEPLNIWQRIAMHQQRELLRKKEEDNGLLLFNQEENATTTSTSATNLPPTSTQQHHRDKDERMPTAQSLNANDGKASVFIAPIGSRYATLGRDREGGEEEEEEIYDDEDEDEDDLSVSDDDDDYEEDDHHALGGFDALWQALHAIGM